ncbi:DUF416 family protein [Utexia brackfieldae]|uniref:YjaG family protein n=1 Tax=Utexia brackfieldae TaxID=3074108 RepID=UPI00370D49FA
MIKNPIQLRLEKLSQWQLKTFMACLCERMYPNYAFFCEQTQFVSPNRFRVILDLVWESLLVKKAKINFESQLDKFELVIPEIEQFDCYSVFPAVDACEALGELLHAYLSDNVVEYAVKMSNISLNTVATYEMTQLGQALSEDELKTLPAILDELDIQWEIYRLLKNEDELNIELIKGLKEDLREEAVSNIGVFLSKQVG